MLYIQLCIYAYAHTCQVGCAALVIKPRNSKGCALLHHIRLITWARSIPLELSVSAWSVTNYHAVHYCSAGHFVSGVAHEAVGSL